MDINNLKSEIFFLLENIKNQAHLSLDNQSKISQIEIDLIMNKIRNLYDKFCDLNIKNKDLINPDTFTEKKEDTSTGNKKQSIINNIIAEKQKQNIEAKNKALKEKTNNIITEEINTSVVEKTIAVELTKAADEEIISPSAKEETTEKEEKITDFAEKIPLTQEEKEAEIIIPEKNVENKKKQKDVDLFSEYAPVADSLNVSHKSLLEKITEEIKDNSIASKLQNDKIDDLKNAIGINEKFLFINDLFNGSMQEYYNSINKLNEYENIETAIIFFNELKEKYSWNNNSDAYKLLNNLLERRY